MNENLNLIEILKDCPKGWKFWSPLLGDVKFNCIYKDFGERCVIECERENDAWKFNTDGTITIGNIPSQTIMLYPSKDQRDWSKFTVKKPKFKVGDRIRHKETNKDDVYEISKVYDDSYGIAGFTWMINMKYQDQYELVPNKFDPNTLKPFDKVLVRDSDGCWWRCALYSHTRKNKEYKYMTMHLSYKYCIPYNEDTKHLVGTTEEAPEFYRYWEE